jgi:hypothetical protein
MTGAVERIMHNAIAGAEDVRLNRPAAVQWHKQEILLAAARYANGEVQRDPRVADAVRRIYAAAVRVRSRYR